MQHRNNFNSSHKHEIKNQLFCNGFEDKSDCTFEEEIADYGYELDHKGLFLVKNWKVSRYLEKFSNLSIKAPELPLFKEVYQKMKLVKFFAT